MPDQAKKAADIPVDRDDLERAQVDLHTRLEQMIDALDAGKAIEPKLFQRALEHIEELEVPTNCATRLRKC